MDVSHAVEQPEQEMLQRLYEMALEMILKFIETVNKDRLDFMHVRPSKRLYNLLMAAVVNDQEKSQNVCKLIGQGFNRLMSGHHNEMFVELGVPAEWSESYTGSLMDPSTFA